MKDATRILVVEDEAAPRQLILSILKREGYQVEGAQNGADALLKLNDFKADLVLCDWRMPKMDGGELLDRLGEMESDAHFIVMTAYGSIDHAVQALRRGADDYLSKPFEREALLMAIGRVLKTRKLKAENDRLRQAIVEQDRYGQLLGKTPSMQRLYHMVEKIAKTDATVLIIGASGTGKELVAKTLHDRSSRQSKPFIAVNCAAIPESLIESELFGHEKGAFTGAHRKRPGKLAEAQGGTLFLDEIPSMPLKIQGSLLRVLQERRYTPLGGQGEVETDVRIVAAANRNLLKMVSEGTFREDLYYRLNVVPIQVPPLAMRKDDIPLLAQAFAQNASEKYGMAPKVFQSKAMEILRGYPWPGNVRELHNMIERLVLLSDGDTIKVDELPPELSMPQPASAHHFTLPPTGLQWDEMESNLLEQALQRAAGNRSAAARLLGMSYKTFLYRLEKYQLA